VTRLYLRLHEYMDGVKWRSFEKKIEVDLNQRSGRCKTCWPTHSQMRMYSECQALAATPKKTLTDWLPLIPLMPILHVLNM